MTQFITTTQTHPICQLSVGEVFDISNEGLKKRKEQFENLINTALPDSEEIVCVYLRTISLISGCRNSLFLIDMRNWEKSEENRILTEFEKNFSLQYYAFFHQQNQSGRYFPL